MAEEPENLVLQQLRLIREETGEMRGDIRRLEARIDALGVRVENLETQMTGISLMMTTLFGAVRNLDHRGSSGWKPGSAPEAGGEPS